MSVEGPTRVAAERLLAVEPVLQAIAPLRDLAALPARTLLHAGPAYLTPDEIPAPVLNAATAAARLEGWAGTREAVREAIATGTIALSPAQDHGVVTPLAFVAGPSTVCLAVGDRARPGAVKIAPLNDGPPPHGLRFGTLGEAGEAVVRDLVSGTGAALAATLAAPLPLLPAMGRALAAGDDLHGRVSAMQAEVLAGLAPPRPAAVEAYLAGAGQFALNVVMAAAALMLAAGEGVAGSRLVTACGANGVRLGIRRGGGWETAPATRPVGPRLPGKEGARPQPAIGDSAVIDALGFGAACLRFCPDLVAALGPCIERGEIDPGFLTAAAHDPFVARHPAFAAEGLRLGLDPERPRSCLGIMLGMVEESGTHGLIGRGIAPWPQ
ncbi:MAG: DUF1116 domain-containing protein [Pseudomonadota bacterium]